MESEIEGHKDSSRHEQENPLCLNCLQPVNPLHHYCPHCGRAVGQLTPIMPYESIRWQADIWGRMWRQLWSRNVSFVGKLFRLLMIIWNVPVMLVGLIPILWHKLNKDNGRVLK
jgi:hypothetical protein